MCSRYFSGILKEPSDSNHEDRKDETRAKNTGRGGRREKGVERKVSEVRGVMGSGGGRETNRARVRRRGAAQKRVKRTREAASVTMTE